MHSWEWGEIRIQRYFSLFDGILLASIDKSKGDIICIFVGIFLCLCRWETLSCVPGIDVVYHIQVLFLVVDHCVYIVSFVLCRRNFVIPRHHHFGIFLLLWCSWWWFESLSVVDQSEPFKKCTVPAGTYLWVRLTKILMITIDNGIKRTISFPFFSLQFVCMCVCVVHVECRLNAIRMTIISFPSNMQ